MGQRPTPEGRDEPVRKSFLEEAFEHRQAARLAEQAAAAEPDEPVEPPAPPEAVAEPEPPPEPAPDVLAAPEPVPAADLALVDEALKKSGLLWVRTSERPGGQALWHTWTNESAYVVTGAGEQPDPGLGTASDVMLIIRSKETTARLISVAARSEQVLPSDPDWADVVAALAKGRLNLVDAGNAAVTWANQDLYAVYRLTPSGGLVEGPGRYPADSHRAAPVATRATTAAPKPRILHRRHGSGPPLS